MTRWPASLLTPTVDTGQWHCGSINTSFPPKLNLRIDCTRLLLARAVLQEQHNDRIHQQQLQDSAEEVRDGVRALRIRTCLCGREMIVVDGPVRLGSGKDTVRGRVCAVRAGLVPRRDGVYAYAAV